MTIKTIKPSGGDFSSLSGWLAYLPATLTAPEQADIYNFGSGGLVETGGVPFTGFTTTSTNKLILNVPSGERHNGGVAHSGAYVTNNGGGAGVTTIRLGNNVDYFDINWLEIESVSSGGAAFHVPTTSTAANNQYTINHSILHGIDAAYGNFSGNGNYTTYNTSIYVTSAARNIDIRGAASAIFGNCQFYTQGGDFVFLGDGSCTVTNCYGGGSSNKDMWNAFGLLGSFCSTSDTTATTINPGTGGINSIAGSTAYTSVTSGSEDFRTKTGFTTWNDAGTTIAAVTNDIIGTARPQGSAYDIGIFENITSTDVTVAATGVAATSAVGSVTPSTSVGVSGVSGSGATGNIGLSIDGSVAVTGVSATGQVGSVTVSGGDTTTQGGHFLPLTEKQLREVKKRERKERQAIEAREQARKQDADSIAESIRESLNPQPMGIAPVISQEVAVEDDDDADLELILLNS